MSAEPDGMGWKGRLERQQYADAQKEEFRKDRRITETQHEVRMREDAHRAHLEGRGQARYNDHDEAGHAAKLKRKAKDKKFKAFMRSAAEECTDDVAADDAYASQACSQGISALPGEQQRCQLPETSSSTPADDAHASQACSQGTSALPGEQQRCQLPENSSSTLLELRLDNAMTSAMAHGVLSEAQCDELTDALAEGQMTTEDCLARVSIITNYMSIMTRDRGDAQKSIGAGGIAHADFESA